MQYILSRPSLRSFFVLFRLLQNTDVRTFWNASVCNLQCNLCNHIAEIVGSLSQRHPQAISIKTNTEVVGYIHTQGRRKDPCQFYSRLDVDQNHNSGTERPLGRLLSAERSILSGAFVMSDPQIYWPHGTVDEENIVVYNSWVDLELKILYYLDPKNEDERIRIGQRGREVALTHHRSWQQAELLFLNDMEYRNDCGLANKPWMTNFDYGF